MTDTMKIYNVVPSLKGKLKIDLEISDLQVELLETLKEDEAKCRTFIMLLYDIQETKRPRWYEKGIEEDKIKNTLVAHVCAVASYIKLLQPASKSDKLPYDILLCVAHDISETAKCGDVPYGNVLEFSKKLYDFFGFDQTKAMKIARLFKTHQDTCGELSILHQFNEKYSKIFNDVDTNADMIRKTRGVFFDVIVTGSNPLLIKLTEKDETNMGYLSIHLEQMQHIKDVLINNGNVIEYTDSVCARLKEKSPLTEEEINCLIITEIQQLLIATKFYNVIVAENPKKCAEDQKEAKSLLRYLFQSTSELEIDANIKKLQTLLSCLEKDECSIKLEDMSQIQEFLKRFLKARIPQLEEKYYTPEKINDCISKIIEMRKISDSWRLTHQEIEIPPYEGFFWDIYDDFKKLPEKLPINGESIKINALTVFIEKLEAEIKKIEEESKEKPVALDDSPKSLHNSSDDTLKNLSSEIYGVAKQTPPQAGDLSTMPNSEYLKLPEKFKEKLKLEMKKIMELKTELQLKLTTQSVPAKLLKDPTIVLRPRSMSLPTNSRDQYL